jgi:transcriptional regulator with XRE-family HTH domain
MIGTGRPQTKDAPAFGKRLATARIAKGWSQTELADRLKTTLKMIDYYERRANNPSVEFVRQAARVLSVPVVELLGEEAQIKRARKTGPTGKVHKVFEEVSKLPRRQQEHIVRVVSALVMQYEQSRQ